MWVPVAISACIVWADNSVYEVLKAEDVEVVAVHRTPSWWTFVTYSNDDMVSFAPQHPEVRVGDRYRHELIRRYTGRTETRYVPLTGETP